MIADEEEQMLADEDGEEMNILLPNDVEGGDNVDNADIEPEIQVTTSDLGIEEVGIVHFAAWTELALQVTTIILRYVPLTWCVMIMLQAIGVCLFTHPPW